MVVIVASSSRLQPVTGENPDNKHNNATMTNVDDEDQSVIVDNSTEMYGTAGIGHGMGSWNTPTPRSTW